MTDPVSLAAGGLAFSVAAIQTTKVVFQWLDGIKNVDEEMECFRAEVQGLASVLEAVRDSFNSIDDESIAQNGSAAIYHFQLVYKTIDDCKKCLGRLSESLPASSTTDQSGKVISRSLSFANLRKKVLLDFKSDRILLLRRQLQSHREVLSLHIGLINLGGRRNMSPAVEKTAIYVLVKDIDSTSEKLRSRLAKTSAGTVGGIQDQTEDAYHRMRDCVRSVKSIISDGSSTVVDGNAEGSFAGFSLTTEKRKNVEKWLQPSVIGPSSMEQPYNRAWAATPSEYGESHWSPQDHHSGYYNGSASVFGGQPAQSDDGQSFHLNRLSILRGASPPMSRISEESSTIQQPKTLTTHLSTRNPFRQAAVRQDDSLDPKSEYLSAYHTDLKKSKSEASTRSNPSNHSDPTASSNPLRAHSAAVPKHQGMRSLAPSNEFSDDFTTAAPRPRRAFSFANRIGDQVAEWDLEQIKDPVRSGHVHSKSSAVAEEMLRSQPSQEIRQRDSSVLQTSNNASSQDLGHRRIPSFKKQDDTASLMPPQSGIPGISPAPAKPPTSPRNSEEVQTEELKHATLLDLRMYESYKKSGQIQNIPSGRCGARRSEKLITRLIEQLGSSAPKETLIEMKKLLVVMYKKQQKFEAAEKELIDLGKLVPEDELIQIQMDQLYVRAEISFQKGKAKEAEKLARKVANHGLSEPDKKVANKCAFESSLMLLITLSEIRADSAEIGAYESFLPPKYRKLQKFRDFCDEIDDLLDEERYRKLDKAVQQGLTTCGFAVSEQRLRAIQSQIRNATSIAKNGKGVASCPLPVFSLAHLLAEKNCASELEVLYRCVDAGPQTKQSLSNDRRNMDLEFNSPLITACLIGCHEAGKVLMEKNCDLNVQNSRNETALHISIHKGHHAFTLDLIERGAGLSIRDSAGQSPLDYARKLNDYVIYNKMLSKGAEDRDSSGQWVVCELPADDLPVSPLEEDPPALELPLDKQTPKGTPATSPAQSSPSSNPWSVQRQPSDATRSSNTSVNDSLPRTNPFSQPFLQGPSAEPSDDLYNYPEPSFSAQQKDIPLHRSATNPFVGAPPALRVQIPSDLSE